jgi:hypothetical protein
MVVVDGWMDVDVQTDVFIDRCKSRMDVEKRREAKQRDRVGKRREETRSKAK